MPAKAKIIGEIEKQVRELCEKGYNAHHISKVVGLAKDTVKTWAKKNGFELAQKTSAKFIDLEPKILEMLKTGCPRKKIQKALGIHFTQITEVAIKNGLESVLRTRADSAIDKILSDEEVTIRITDGSKYIGYSRSKGKYGFVCPRTSKTYYKDVTHLTQGSPYGKSGHPLTEEDFNARLAAIGHTLEPGTFTKTKAPAIVYCSKGHKRELHKASYALKFGCPVCGNNGTSKMEQDLLAWVRQYYPDANKYKFEERVTKPKEIDVYIPSLRLGIEFCGLHFHGENELNEEHANDNKHYKKMLAASALGIRLITIFENEWVERQDQVKNFLLSTMKKNSRTVGGRECLVKSLEPSVFNEFLDAYHIQGAGQDQIGFGLFLGEELLGVITGGKHPRRGGDYNDDLYLNRLAFKSGVTVMGGATKLFNELRLYAIQNRYLSIQSWSDNRWSEGNVYKQLGFIFDSQKLKGRGLSDGSIWPDFQYAMGGKLYSREAIKRMGLNDMDLNKIYDCGKKRWVYNLI